MISTRGKRALVALLFAFTLTAGLVATPASAGTEFKDLPSGGFPCCTSVIWSSPNPFHQVVLMNTWYTVTLSNGCTQQVKVGNFNGYAYGQMRYISGNCWFGGLGLSYVVNGSAYVTTNPTWYDDAVKKECVVGNGSAWFCTQLGDGSIWNQPQQSMPNNFGTSVIGIHVTSCRQTGTWPSEVDYCTTWWLTVF